MKKLAVVYWTGTGNTEKMANAVVDGAKGVGADVSLFEVNDFSVDTISDYDAIAFGCPAMGDEELEEVEFAPMFDEAKGLLGAKPIGLFGSYSWADGEWMDNWVEDCNESGLNIATDPVIAFDDPDDDAIEACKTLGANLGK